MLTIKHGYQIHHERLQTDPEYRQRFGQAVARGWRKRMRRLAQTSGTSPVPTLANLQQAAHTIAEAVKVLQRKQAVLDEARAIVAQTQGKRLPLLIRG